MIWGDYYTGQTIVPVEAQSGVVAITAGAGHRVVVKTDGGVLAWGRNDFGQTNVPVAAQSGVTAIAAGDRHTVALKSDGSVVAWGLNNLGQTTVPAAAQSGVTAIAAGSDHTVALKNDGSVVAWGYNFYGQSTVPPAAQSGVTAIAAGYGHTVVLKTNGTVFSWGYGEVGSSGQNLTNVPPEAQNGVTAIAAGNYHTVVLKSNGSVVAWGSYQTNVPPAAQSGVVAIAAGNEHTVALKSDGSVVDWGSSSIYSHHQTNVPAVAQSGVLAIGAGGDASLAIVLPTVPAIITEPVSLAVNAGQSATFTVVATGYPLNFQWRQDGTNISVATDATYRINNTWFSDAGSYSVVVSNSLATLVSTSQVVLTVNPVPTGSVVAWPGPDVPLAAQSGVVAIAQGGYHTIARKADGHWMGWGLNYFGQLTGTPTTNIANITVDPLTLGGQALTGIIAVSGGAYHTLALNNNGGVTAWGRNEDGETGVPDEAQFDEDDPVPGASPVVAVAAGGDGDDDDNVHSLALTASGRVLAWGNNRFGQANVPVDALSGVTAIAAGSYHSVALKNDGTIIQWGRVLTNVLATAQSGITAIAAGDFDTVALKADGGVLEWHYDGRVGTNVPVAAQSGVVAIAAGLNVTTMALKNDGSVVQWDYYWGGQTSVPMVARSGVTAIAAGSQGRGVALIGGPVTLHAIRRGGDLVLTWPFSGYTLQSTEELTPNPTWMDVTNLPAPLGAQWAVTNTFSGETRFYRLTKP